MPQPDAETRPGQVAKVVVAVVAAVAEAMH